MRTKDIKIAEQFGIIVRCKAFESDLLKIRDIVPDKIDNGICFDLTGFLSDIHQVIIVPKYNIRPERGDYWEARQQLCENIVALAGKYDLHPSGDRIEDYGEHFYFVFNCGKSWVNQSYLKSQHNINCDKRKEGIIMQNIINFENIASDKKVSVNLINELIGYAENEANILAIRKAVASVRSRKILPTASEPEQKKNGRSENWYKTHYNSFKQKNEKHLRNALAALRETGLTNPEITQKTGYFKVNELIGATPKPLLVARRERINAERREKMFALRKQGMNKTQIAKALGVSTAMVYNLLGKYTDEERREIQLQTIQHCLETRKISGKFKGVGHWMHAAKENRVRELGPMVDKMQKAGIPYRKIEAVLGYGEDTLRMYRKQYLASIRHDS